MYIKSHRNNHQHITCNLGTFRITIIKVAILVQVRIQFVKYDFNL
jgi:hypothetical protein